MVQRYGGFLPIPRKIPNSSLTCSDNRPDLRHIRQMPSKSVAHKRQSLLPSSDHPEVTAAPSSDHPAHPGTPPNLGGEKDTEEPIVISSGYRSPEVNRKVGGSATSNHLTGCAVDIRVYGIEQALRYAVILMDYADETRQDYDELLIERNRSGRYWVHFAVRPKENRRKTMIIQK